MSLKRNILASYASQAYVTVIGIVMVPVYIRYMGAEAYGLVGVFGVLQAFFQLLDMGLSPTLSRQSARVAAGSTTAAEFRGLLRALELVFGATALIGGVVLAAGAGTIATGWLKVERLPLAEVEASVQLMALGAGLRWISGLYRGGIAGFEHQVWLGAFNAAIATLRFAAVVPLFVFVGTTPTTFFLFQAAVAVLEVLGLMAMTYRILSEYQPREEPRTSPSWDALRQVLSFAVSMSMTNVLWIVVTQSDRVLLSKLLPLSEYAHFTVVILIASGIQIAGAPLGNVLMARLSKLCALDDRRELARVYRAATRLLLALVGPVALTLAFFPHRTLFV